MNPAVVFYRVGHWFHRNGMRRIGWGVSWISRFLFATWVPSSARIGSEIVLGYWGLGIVIHKDAVIGNNCQIGQNVTVGRNPGKKGVPVIGNSVYIGAGAVVSGDIKIESYVVIGANSVVLSDIPEFSLVVGAPARIVRTLDPEEHQRIMKG